MLSDVHMVWRSPSTTRAPLARDGERQGFAITHGAVLMYAVRTGASLTATTAVRRAVAYAGRTLALTTAAVFRRRRGGRLALQVIPERVTLPCGRVKAHVGLEVLVQWFRDVREHLLRRCCDGGVRSGVLGRITGSIELSKPLVERRVWCERKHATFKASIAGRRIGARCEGLERRCRSLVYDAARAGAVRTAVAHDIGYRRRKDVRLLDRR